MVINRGLRPLRLEPFSMNGQAISPSECVKILGITFDHKLSYRLHVQNTINKATIIYRKMCGMARPTFGLEPAILMRMYHTIIVPIISYGCVVWNKALQYRKVRESLRRLQRVFAQMAVKSYRTASFISTTAVAGFPPS